MIFFYERRKFYFSFCEWFDKKSSNWRIYGIILEWYYSVMSYVNDCYIILLLIVLFKYVLIDVI